VAGAGNRSSIIEGAGVLARDSAGVRVRSGQRRRVLADRSIDPCEVVPTDLFEYLDWQQSRQVAGGGKAVALRRRGPAPATMNRRITAVRGLFEHLVWSCVVRVPTTRCRWPPGVGVARSTAGPVGSCRSPIPVGWAAGARAQAAAREPSCRGRDSVPRRSRHPPWSRPDSGSPARDESSRYAHVRHAVPRHPGTPAPLLPTLNVPATGPRVAPSLKGSG